MLALTLPGAIAAKRPCETLESAPIGPQLVSPSARRPTSISGSAEKMAISVIHTGRPKNAYWMAQSATVSTTMPPPTQASGNSLSPPSTPRNARIAFTSRRQRSTSAVMPPASIMPTPGHITQ